MKIRPYKRDFLWKYLPKGMRIAELGVDKGWYSNCIMVYAEPKKLYLVDYFGTDPTYPVKESDLANLREKYKDDNRVEFYQGNTVHFLRDIDELDAVYIDSAHEYQQTVDELELSWQKCKMFITGHDYVPIFGVVQAVNEFVAKYNLKLELTDEKGEYYPSFVIDVRGIKR